MKCRRVKPKPWEVRRKCTVFGLGHENASSSVGYCPTRESAKLLHSGESFCREKNVIISISVRKSHLLNISNEYIAHHKIKNRNLPSRHCVIWLYLGADYIKGLLNDHKMLALVMFKAPVKHQTAFSDYRYVTHTNSLHR